MLRFAALGSGSRGNALLVQGGSTHILIDCGFSRRECERRLGQLGCELDQLSAVVVTHEHADHVSGAAAVARASGAPLWLSEGTRAALGTALDAIDCRCFSSHEPFAVEALRVNPFPVPHDAREPCQLRIDDGASSIGVLTDAGHVSRAMTDALAGVGALFLECNHDEEMLRTGNYPPSLKARVGGPYGHLSNRDAAALLKTIGTDGMQHLMAGHLSEKNNSPGHARSALAAAADCDPQWIRIASQGEVLDWCEIR